MISFTKNPNLKKKNFCGVGGGGEGGSVAEGGGGARVSD